MEPLGQLFPAVTNLDYHNRLTPNMEEHSVDVRTFSKEELSHRP